ncbi:MAG: lactonase family protein [Bacteroidetes bacterium]|nr:lactonase family protein [Bacteroidota bacterium]
MKSLQKALFILLFIVFSIPFYAQTLFVGTYTDTESKGIYTMHFDTISGKLTQKNLVAEIENPSYLVLSADSKYLYAVQETNDFNGQNSGAISAFQIGSDNQLTRLNSVSSEGAHPCHIAMHPEQNLLSATNYSGGTVSVFKKLPDGKIGEAFQVIQHKGNGPDVDRQESPHPHSSQFSSDGLQLMTADLGNDNFAVYNWDGQQFNRDHTATVNMNGGRGPRHFAQTKDHRYIYVLNELTSSVTVLKRSANGWEKTLEVSSLSPNFKGKSQSADIHLSLDEQFLYVSNRGENSIAIFKTFEDGGLSYSGFVSTRGNWPRNFTLDPSGKYMLVANQLSDNISVYKIDTNSGLPSFLWDVKMPRPVCLVFKP